MYSVWSTIQGPVLDSLCLNIITLLLYVCMHCHRPASIAMKNVPVNLAYMFTCMKIFDWMHGIEWYFFWNWSRKVSLTYWLNGNKRTVLLFRLHPPPPKSFPVLPAAHIIHFNLLPDCNFIQTLPLFTECRQIVLMLCTGWSSVDRAECYDGM